ncbi:hypothetical protein Q9233_001075 [Columba guinea]|nr:hypothetical protein Q9233_001075 [Columba guinea]
MVRKETLNGKVVIIFLWKTEEHLDRNAQSRGSIDGVPGFWSWRKENDVEEAEALMWEGHGIIINSSGTSDN